MTAPISNRRGLLVELPAYRDQSFVDGDYILVTLRGANCGTLWERLAEGKRRDG